MPCWIAWRACKSPTTVHRVPTPPSALPLTVSFRDPSSPIGVNATITVWRVDDREPGQPTSVTLTIGAGTLDDKDKGTFPLEDVRVVLVVAGGRFEPGAVLDPGVLTDFQQDGLLDAVISALNALDPPLLQHVSE